MVQSMTGYGRSEALLKEGRLIFEIRSLNGKNADISIKSPLLPKDKEIEVRKYLAETLVRGTIDVFITWEPNAAESARSINEDLAAAYYGQMRALAEKLGIPDPYEASAPMEVLSSLLRLPDVLDLRKQDVITQENWPLAEKALKEAAEHLREFRQREGEALRKDVTQKVQTILGFVDEMESYEKERIDAIREELLKKFDEASLPLDRQRLEQEMIYYLEKLDINEEKVRLRQHCHYYLDTLENEPASGRKLGFIAQEMGREINTTGSKANHAGIQKIVVRMKDELEKIKEQSLNIL
ncbi:MAG: YicC family protein [Bacteroidales bacterium]|nr:YicC family protein [Bacteroidales bacterium]